LAQGLLNVARLNASDAACMQTLPLILRHLA